MNNMIVISSVAIESIFDTKSNEFHSSWEELPPGIVYRMDVTTGEVTSMQIPRIINREVQLSLSDVISSTEPSVDAAAKQYIALQLVYSNVHPDIDISPIGPPGSCPTTAPKCKT